MILVIGVLKTNLIIISSRVNQTTILLLPLIVPKISLRTSKFLLENIVQGIFPTVDGPPVILEYVVDSVPPVQVVEKPRSVPLEDHGPYSITDIPIEDQVVEAESQLCEAEEESVFFVTTHNGISVATNNAIRSYESSADEQFRNLLITSNNKKGPVTHRSHIFTDNYTLPPSSMVCEDGKRSLTVENAGGKSDISEMYSIDYFTQMYGATNTIFEKEVNYWIDYKLVDFICTIDDHRVGVSVARAMGYPTSENFTSQIASKLLYKKLYGLIVARNAVVKEQSFFKSILHIWCQDAHVAQLLCEAFSNLDDNDYGLDVKGVVLLQLTICDDPQLYKNFIR